MKALERRIRTLENRYIDSSGFAPHTQKWRAYWHEKIRQYVRAGYQGPRPPIPLFPLDAFRDFLQTEPDYGDDHDD